MLSLAAAATTGHGGISIISYVAGMAMKTPVDDASPDNRPSVRRCTMIWANHM
jgi:hypothetical protein